MLILLACVDEGLGACFFGLPVDRIDAFRDAFGVPADFRPIGAISVGYPADAPSGRGGRVPLEQVVHRGRW
jgi:nitroreductase